MRLDTSELVSVTLPLQPAFINPGHRLGLAARDWRHRETAWYDREHQLLTRLRDWWPEMVDYLRLLLEAVFVKQAHHMRRERMERKSYQRFIKEYESFCKGQRKNLLPAPDDFLQRVDKSDYLFGRLALTTAFGPDEAD